MAVITVSSLEALIQSLIVHMATETNGDFSWYTGTRAWLAVYCVYCTGEGGQD